MASSIRQALFAALLTTAAALDGIVVPSDIKAGEEIKVTFQNANNDQYRVYLAAALAGSNGPTCYLINSTTLSNSDSITVSIPADVGPTAAYYSIAISDLTTAQGATYSNRFNLTGATGQYSDYENHLGGSPFWSADNLPCTAYSCARQCAHASYPADLTEDAAYETMKSCILDCEGVTPAASQTGPAHASTSTSTSTSAATATATSGDAAEDAVAPTSSSSVASGNRGMYFAGAAAAGFAGLAFAL